MDLSSARTCLQKLLRRTADGKTEVVTQELLARCGTKEGLSKDAEVLISVVREICARRDGVEWELLALALLLTKENETVLRDLLLKNSFFPFLLFGLDHSEPRVRQLCISLLMPAGKILCLEQPHTMHEALAPTLLARIREKFVRSATLQTPLLGDATFMPLDDTTGWSTLESHVSAYFEVLQCCGYPTIINVLSDSDVCELLITQCSIHRNRFVREAAIGFIQSICELIDEGVREQSGGSPTQQPRTKEEVIKGYKMSTRWGLSRRITEALKTGLEDNWSRIRQASCKSALVFLAGLAEQEDEARSSFMAKLLPGICLNRFYAADGVKATAADTWRGIVGSRGRELICALIESFATSYAEMSKVNNHMISEAACSAMAELISRIDRNVVQTQLPRFVEALAACLADDSWPVRDSSCVATGVLLRHFGKEAIECDSEIIASFLDVCARHLKDAVWSLRENAALALGNACQSENAELSEKIKSFITSYLNANLGKAIDATVGTRTISFLTSEQLLALEMASSPPSAPHNPKKVAWRQGGGWGCCLDCMETRAGDGCDISSGAVYLLREFAGLQPLSATQHLETVWSLLDLDCAASTSSASTITLKKKKEKLIVSLLEILPDILLRLSPVQAASDSWMDVGRVKLARLKMCDSESVQAAARNII